MQIVEYYRDTEKSEFVLGWKQFFRYKISGDFKLGNILIDPMFSDLLFLQIQNIEKCFTKEEIHRLKKLRFGLDKEQMYVEKLSNLNYSALIKKLIEYSRKESWGSDLEYYLESVEFVKNKLLEYETAEIYFVNIEDEKFKNLIVYPGTFTYYISILAISKNYDQLIAIDLGGD